MQAVGEFERGETRRLRHRHVVATLDDVEQRRRDAEAAGLDLVRDVTAVLVQQNRPAEHKLEVDLGMRVQLLDEQLTASVIRAVRNRKADTALPDPRNLRRSRRRDESGGRQSG